MRENRFFRRVFPFPAIFQFRFRRYGSPGGRTALAAIATAVGLAALTASGPAVAQTSFPAWLNAFKQDAARAGVSRQTLDRAFEGVTLNERVIELDQRQPEFATPIWTYLDRLVNAQRVNDGLSAYASQQPTLKAIEERYGVPGSVVAAIWGVESNFGQNRGSFNVIEALATLAFDGRRERFGRTQLIEALKIIDSGDVAAQLMFGSWAGAMGHTQFIPTSYRDYAVDFTGDGKRDIWSDDPADALASTANYLASFGWRPAEPWGFEVRIPAGFDYSLIGEVRLPTRDWAARNVTLANGRPLPDGLDEAELILPAGAEGPAFLVLNNFRTLLRYNNAASYALAVSLLAERFDGQPPRAFAWPQNDRPLSIDEGKELQQALTDLGFDTGGVDGVLGRRSRSAVRAFQRSQSLIPDGYPSASLLAFVRRAKNARQSPVLAIPAGDVGVGDIREIQALLIGIGFDTGGIDGLVGSRTRRAISRFAQQRGMPSTDEPSLQILAELRKAVRASRSEGRHSGPPFRVRRSRRRRH